MPGDNVEMVVTTYKPVAAEAGQRFNIREGGRTVATGLITRVLDSVDAKGTQGKHVR